jgi:beta-hydroxyacyl-ACP dehydratase FabZ
MGEQVLDINKIMSLLPHRYPFLLIDKILEWESAKRIVGIKNVTINEPFFQGHFPGHPIMPGVLLVEAMAQTAGVLALMSDAEPEKKVLYFMGIDKAKFRKPVVPGDQVRFEMDITKTRGKIHCFQGVAKVGDVVVAEAEMMAMVVDK